MPLLTGRQRVQAACTYLHCCARTPAKISRQQKRGDNGGGVHERRGIPRYDANCTGRLRGAAGLSSGPYQPLAAPLSLAADRVALL